MALIANHISASHHLRDGQSRNILGVSGSVLFNPSDANKIVGARALDAAIISGHSDSAFIVSGTISGNDKAVFLGDATVSGSVEVKKTGGSASSPDFLAAGYSRFNSTVDINAALDVDAGAAIHLSGTTVGAVANGALTLQSVNGAIDVDAAGAIDILAGTTFSIDGTGASNVTATSGNLTLSSATSGNVVVSSAGTVDVDADGGALSLDGSGGINIGTEADVAIDIDSSTLDIDASGAITVDSSGGAIGIGTENHNHNINIGTDGTRTITIGEDSANDKTFKVHASAADIVLDAGSNDVAITGGVTVSGNATVSGDLSVLGTMTQLQVANSFIEDTLMQLGSGSTSAGDRGLVMRQTATAGKVFAWDQSESAFMLGTIDNSPAVLNGTSNDVTADSFDALRLGSVQLGGATNVVRLGGASGADLEVVAAADIHLQPNGGEVYVTGSVLPVTDDTYDLGSSSNAWQDLFLEGDINFSDGAEIDVASGKLIVDVAGDIELQAGGGEVYVTGSLVPGADDTYDLGSSTLAWQDAYLEGDLYFTDQAEIDVAAGKLIIDVAGDIELQAGGGEVYVTGSMLPGADDTYDLGSSTLAWQDLFLEGDINFSDEAQIDVAAGSLQIDVAGKIQLDPAGAVVGITGSMLPGADDTYDLGSSAMAWKDAYLEGDLYFTDSAEIDIASGNLTIDAADSINLSAANDVNIPQDVGLTFDGGAGSLKIEADGTDLSLYGGSSGNVIAAPGSSKGLVPQYSASTNLGQDAAYTNQGSLSGWSTDLLSGQTLGSSGPQVVKWENDGASLGSAKSGSGSGSGELFEGKTQSLTSSTTSISIASGVLTASEWTVGTIFSVKASSAYMHFIVTSAPSGSSTFITCAYIGDALTGVTGEQATLSNPTDAYALSAGASGSKKGIDSGLAANIRTDYQVDLRNSGGDIWTGTPAATVSGGHPALILTRDSTNSTVSSAALADYTTVANYEAIDALRWKSLFVDKIDLNGSTDGVVFDADADTSLRASADDTLMIKVGGTDTFKVTTSAIAANADNSYDLGTTALRYRNIYTGDLNLKNDRGDWTLIEENDFISFRNNKTGRRFRMLMEDITGMGNYGPGNDGEM